MLALFNKYFPNSYSELVNAWSGSENTNYDQVHLSILDPIKTTNKENKHVYSIPTHLPTTHKM